MIDNGREVIQYRQCLSDCLYYPFLIHHSQEPARSAVSCDLIVVDLQKSNQNNKNQAMLTTCNLYRETAGRQRDERLHRRRFPKGRGINEYLYPAENRTVERTSRGKVGSSARN